METRCYWPDWEWPLRVDISNVRTMQFSVLLLSLFSLLLANAVAQSPAPMNRIDLHNGWTVQTSRKVHATGDVISTPRFQTKGWYRTSVPMTVVAVQVAAGEFPKPYYGMNLQKFRGLLRMRSARSSQTSRFHLTVRTPHRGGTGQSFRRRPIMGTWRSILTESITARMRG